MLLTLYERVQLVLYLEMTRYATMCHIIIDCMHDVQDTTIKGWQDRIMNPVSSKRTAASWLNTPRPCIAF